MVLVVEAKDTTQVIGHLLQLLPQTPVLLTCEEPADSPDDQKKVLEYVAKLPEERVRPIYLYATDSPSMKSPAVVDPRDPDALFRQQRSGRPRA
jgi:hypothetical protein